MKRNNRIIIFTVITFLIISSTAYSWEWPGSIHNTAPKAGMQIKPVVNIDLNIGYGNDYTQDQIQSLVNSQLKSKFYTSGINANINIQSVENQHTASMDYVYYTEYTDGNQNNQEYYIRGYDVAKKSFKAIVGYSTFLPTEPNGTTDTGYNQGWSSKSWLYEMPDGRAYFYQRNCVWVRGNYLGSGYVSGTAYNVDWCETILELDAGGTGWHYVAQIYRNPHYVSNLTMNSFSNITIDMSGNLYYTDSSSIKYIYNASANTTSQLAANATYGTYSLNSNCYYTNSDTSEFSYGSTSKGYRKFYFDNPDSTSELIATASSTSTEYDGALFFISNTRYIDTFAQGLSWSNSSYKFTISVDKRSFERLNISSIYNTVISSLKSSNSYFIGVGSGSNQSQYNNLINSIPMGGNYISGTDINQAFSDLSDYIINKVTGVNLVLEMGDTSITGGNILSKVNSIIVPKLKAKNIYISPTVKSFNSFKEAAYDNNYFLYKVVNGASSVCKLYNYNSSTGTTTEYNLMQYFAGTLSKINGIDIQSAVQLANGYMFFYLNFTVPGTYVDQNYNNLIKVAPDGTITRIFSIGGTNNYYADWHVDYPNNQITTQLHFVSGNSSGGSDTPASYNNAYDLNGGSLGQKPVDVFPGIAFQGLVGGTYYNAHGSKLTTAVYSGGGLDLYYKNSKVYHIPSSISSGTVQFLQTYVDINSNLYNELNISDWSHDINIMATIDDGIIDELQTYNEVYYQGLMNIISTQGIYYAGLGRTAYSSYYNNLVNPGTSNTLIDNSNIDTALNQLADYIINVVNQKLHNIYVVLGSDVSTNTTYEDYESDPKYKDDWIVNFEDPYYFKNPTYKSGSLNYEGETFSNVFNNVGKYEVYYKAQDNPKNDDKFAEYRLWSDPDIAIVYVHRRPIADFNIIITDGSIPGRYNAHANDVSYDLDHQGETGNGIVAWEWAWKLHTSSNWTTGIFNVTNVVKGTQYDVSLRVKDKEGAWSDTLIKTISVDITNNAPIARFAVSNSLSITDQSSDPDGDPLVEWHWKLINISTGTVIKDYGITTYGSGKPVPSDFYNLGVEKCRISLEVKDNPTARLSTLTALWSAPYYQDVDINLLKLTNFRITDMVNPPTAYTFPITTADMPAECKSGYRNSFAVNVEGQADTVTVQASDSNGNNLGTINMIKLQDIDSQHSIWGLKFITELDTPPGTIFNFKIVGKRGSYTFDYNSTYSWSGDSLRIIGNALEDTKIYRKY